MVSIDFLGICGHYSGCCFEKVCKIGSIFNLGLVVKKIG